MVIIITRNQHNPISLGHRMIRNFRTLEEIRTWPLDRSQHLHLHLHLHLHGIRGTLLRLSHVREDPLLTYPRVPTYPRVLTSVR